MSEVKKKAPNMVVDKFERYQAPATDEELYPETIS